MLTGFEFVMSLAAIGCGIAMFILALRQRPARRAVVGHDAGTAGIMKANVYALAVIALIFFGTAFLIDVFS